MIKHGAGAVVAALTLLATAGTAFAHAHLKSATPAVNATISHSPAELDLVFSEGVNLAFTGATLTGPEGVVVQLGRPTLAPGDDKTLVVPVPTSLAPGRYKVEWHALATDGHKTTGSYGFVVKP